MKKFLRFSFVALLTMIGMNVMAEEVTIDFSAQGYGNGQAIESLTQDGITLTFDKGTNTNGPKYYTTGSAIRLYGSNTMKVESSSDITSIVFTFASGEGTNEITSDNGTFGTATWTGNTTEVTFTIGGTSGHRRIQKMVFTLGGTADSRTDTKIEFAEGYTTRCTPGKDETVALPVATVKAGDTAVEGATVTWTSSNEEMAPIVDGAIKPVNGSQGSVTITASYEGNDTYKPSTKNYTLKLYKGYVVLSELVKDLNSTNEKWDNGGELASFWMGEMTDGEFKSVETLVTYASGNYTYISDGTNYMLFYGKASVFGNNEQKLKAGDKITLDYGQGQGFDAIWGKAYRYNKLPEFSVEQMVVRVASENNEVAYTTITADQIGNNLNAPVKIENAQLDSINSKNIYFHVGDVKLAVYNQFAVATESLELGAAYTLYGMGSIYKTTEQLYLIDFVKTAESSINTIQANRFSGAIYNLRGQRVQTMSRGLYIRDGKKIVVK